MIREKSTRLHTEKQEYVGPKAMNLIRADLIAMVNFENFEYVRKIGQTDPNTKEAFGI